MPGITVQYLTHDGDGQGDVINSSAPNNRVWNSVLGFPWRRGVWGDWLDANQQAFGTSTAGAVPYASVPVPAPGRYAVSVTALVSRWLGGANRGFYLRMRGNAFSVWFAGRAASDAAARPKLVVVTTVGTFSLGARCNACWAISAVGVISSWSTWRLAGQVPAILQFDLTPVSGTLVSASLEFTDVSHDVGSTMARGVVDVFEADPPSFVVPDEVPSPHRGIAAGLSSFAALSSQPNVLFSSDFATPGWADGGWDHGVERIVNEETGTTYARSRFVAGSNTSASVRRNVSRGTGPQGAPDVVVPELYGQYWLYLDADFGSNVDSVKFPAMGVQFGYWNPVGYWQQTTGNGGTRGTGLKVWNSNLGRWEYQGHSIRVLTSQRPADRSAYDGLFGLAFYPYNLDQTGPFPAGENFPYIAIRRERWYCMDMHIKQNSIVGPFDANGNGTAVADGQLRAWINGYPVYSKKTFRWRRNAEFGVQGIWVDFYHGGKQPAPYTMHYRIDRVTLATDYIGPP